MTTNPVTLHAPFAGIVHYHVADGERVDVGATVATVEAVKLEAPVVAPAPGVIRRSEDGDFLHVNGGDALLDLLPVGPADAAGSAGTTDAEEARS